MKKDFWSTSKRFWQTIRRLSQRKNGLVQAVLSWDGDFLILPGYVVRRRKEHFEDLLKSEEIPAQGEAGLEDSAHGSFPWWKPLVVKKLRSAKASGWTRFALRYWRPCIKSSCLGCHTCSIAHRNLGQHLAIGRRVWWFLFFFFKWACSNYRGITCTPQSVWQSLCQNIGKKESDQSLNLGLRKNKDPRESMGVCLSSLHAFSGLGEGL